MNFQPSNLIPRFSNIMWGICLPNACTNEDAEHILNELLKPYNITGVQLRIEVYEENCYEKNKKNWIIILEQNWHTTLALLVTVYFVRFSLMKCSV